MRAMKHPDLIEKLYTYTRTLALTDLGPEIFEQSLNIPPLNVAGYRVSEECRKGFLVLTLHDYSIK